MSKKMVIDIITPEPSDGDALKNWYFKDEADGLNLYNSQNVKQSSDIKLGTQFSVTVPGYPTFYLTVNSLGMTGSWSDQPQIKDVPGSGTFQAQAGGGTVADDEAASSAKA